MEKTKKKMSNRRFRAITIPIISAAALIAVVATVAANIFSTALDDYLGRGASHVVSGESGSKLKADYYEDNYNGYEESKVDGYKVAKQTAEEGMVLLKNKDNTLPLAKDTAVAPLGYRFFTPVYGQTGSAGSAKWTVEPTTPYNGLKQVFTNVKNLVSRDMKTTGTPQSPAAAPGTVSEGSLNSAMGGDSKIYEYPESFYSQYASDLKGTTALIMLARTGSEGSDKKYDAYDDGTPHYLALSKNEKDLIKLAKANCDKVVVLLASSAVMEVTPLMSGELEVDAILQVGHLGEKGYDVLGSVLSGDVNPSGRTVDTWASNLLNDPSTANFGEFNYTNAMYNQVCVGEKAHNRWYIEYQEDIYVGYRYYETAAVMDTSFKYSEAVNFPFGHGLSYTHYTKSIKSYEDSGDEIKVTVNVKNDGAKAGKEVVEVYYTAPYTEFDAANGIEKSVVNLAGFSKTKVLQPNEDQDVEITFTKESMASYCASHDNGNGTYGSYFLEGGDYEISLRENSHDVIETKTTRIDQVWYSGDNARKSEHDAQSKLEKDGTVTNEAKTSYVTASNRFDDMEWYMNNVSHRLSRKDWAGTKPTTDTDRKKALSEDGLKLLGIEETFDPLTDKTLGNVEGSEIYQAEDREVKAGNLKVSDMRGIPYTDSKWDEILDQVDYSDSTTMNQIQELMKGACYVNSQLDAVGLPQQIDADGANGIKAVKDNDGMNMTATYGYAPLIASTWNTELLEEMGNMLGKEAMETGVNGWYSPAINIHRSQFSGRVYEYYSEDPLLTGKLASAIVSGAGNAGMYTFIKHFALNDQETQRQNLVHTWASEQATREIYLKAFEIPYKEATMTVKYYDSETGEMTSRVMRAATACMASQNDIGGCIGHGNKALLTDILREEWGFEGVVISDMYIWSGKANMYELSFRSGCDAFLSYSTFGGFIDTTSPTAHGVMRRAIKDFCYTVANSSAMQGVAPGSTVSYDMSPWRIGLITGDVVIGCVVAGVVAWIVLRAFDEKKNPDKYKTKETI